MKRIRNLMLGAALSLLTAVSMAATVDVSGVKMEDTIDFRGAKLELNGAGVRYKAVFKVYAAGLYLTKKAGTAEEVMVATGPKRLSITMLREIDSAELGKLFTRGRGGQQPPQRDVQAHSGPDAHEPDLQRPEETLARRELPDRVGPWHWHGHHRQGQGAGRTFQGARVLQCVDADLARPQPG
jgi:hypothetical protein